MNNDIQNVFIEEDEQKLYSEYNVDDSIKERARVNHMKYMDGMEDIGSDIMDKVISEMEIYEPYNYTEDDVKEALSKEFIDKEDFKALLSPAAETFIEEIAQKAKKVKERYFGNNIYMFTPLYLSNYCENHCIYCGFNCYNKINRMKLDDESIEKELQAIAKSGLQEILLLTGESRTVSGVDYIANASRLARKYFKVVGVEVYPLNSDEYAIINEAGADYVTVFQETYNSDKYEKLHLAGHKRIFPYRLNSQERALIGGMRGVGFAALLGLSDFRKDAFATGYHAALLQSKYPHSEIAISSPRLRPIINNEKINPKDVHQTQLLQVVCAYRLFLPYANITISTRENQKFRDNIIKIAATKISAGVSTGIGGHCEENTDENKGDEQFEIADDRNVEEVLEAIKKEGLQPVMSDYVDAYYNRFKI